MPLKLKLDKLYGKSLLLAHSGGLDSCVLAHILHSKKISFSVAHCNFQLRGIESDQDLLFVEKWCKEQNITFFQKKFDIYLYKSANKKSIQEAARELRYNWFNLLMNDNGFELLLTAHHLNDQLETFLINITRGTGIRGLLGIPEREKIVRPMRKVSKKEILAYAKINKIKWREDSSNSSQDYMRNKIRHKVALPLENHKPESLKNFKNTLKHLSQAEQFISHQLDELKNELFIKKGNEIHIEIQALKKLKPLKFCLHNFFSPLGFDAKEVEKLIGSISGKFLISKSHRLIRDRNHFILSNFRKKQKIKTIINLEDNNLKLPIPIEWKIITSKNKISWTKKEACLDKDKLKKPLCLRKYMKGDYFCPSGMKGKKLLSKFFRDEKYSILEKEEQWLLCSQDKIVWIIGKRCDRRFIAGPKTKNILLISLVK